MVLKSLYGPDVTFVGIDKCNITDPGSLKEVDVVIVGAPYDGGTSFRPGARFAPSAIRSADYLPYDGVRPHLGLGVDPFKELVVRDGGDIPLPPTDIMHALGLVSDAVETIVNADIFPVILGGDHSITYANVVALTRKYGKGNVGVMHFDAHPDTADQELDQPHGHGQWVRRLIDDGYVKGHNFVQVGVRGYWPDHPVLKWMAKQNMRTFEISEIQTTGLDVALKEAMQVAAEGCKTVFLSVDIDVCDPAFSPGTGTPEPGGLTSRELLNAVRTIALSLDLCGLDIVEVSPPYDHADITALLANRTALEVISVLAAKKVGVNTVGRPLLGDFKIK